MIDDQSRLNRDQDKQDQLGMQQDNTQGKPLDPTSNQQDFGGDKDGQTGITVDESKNQPNNAANLPGGNQSSGNANNTQNNPNAVARSMSSSKHDDSLEVSSLKDTDPNQPHQRPNVELPGTDLDNNPMTPDHSEGESSVGSSTPRTDSDDDTLQNSHDMGLRLNEDEEHPQELDVASDVDKAEEYHKTH